MIYVQISILLFFVSVLVHIGIHKLLLKIGIITFKAWFVFLLGFILNSYILFSYSTRASTKELFFVSLLIYPLLALDYILIIMTPYLGYISPSSKIILLLKKKGMTRKEILNHFSNQEEIDQRLTDLLNDRLIQKTRSHYTIQNKGTMFLRFISFYRNVFNLRSTG